MKPDIHPKYYDKTEVHCACGNTFIVGSTKPSLEIEICSRCHPFFTGKTKLVDASGRVERYKARIAKKAALDEARKKRAIRPAARKRGA